MAVVDQYAGRNDGLQTERAGDEAKVRGRKVALLRREADGDVVIFARGEQGPDGGPASAAIEPAWGGRSGTRVSFGWFVGGGYYGIGGEIGREKERATCL
jgi:hypothetical protein